MPDATLSLEELEMGVGESRLYTFDFTSQLFGATLVTVSSVTQTLSDGSATSALTLGSGTINVSQIDAEDDDEDDIAAGHAVQVRVTAGTGDAGSYIVYVFATTTGGDTLRLGGQLTVNA